MHDYLTDIYNRRAFFIRIYEELNRIKRYQETMAIILADIDNFKNINDIYGHKAGDEVLREIATLFRNECRDYDFVARFGGEEFIFYIHNVEIKEAIEIAERIRKKVEKHEFNLPEQKLSIKVTVSFGVACLTNESKYDAERVIIRADKALYFSKENGRNRVSYFE